MGMVIVDRCSAKPVSQGFVDLRVERLWSLPEHERARVTVAYVV